VLAPAGFTRIADPQGELDTAVFGRRERDVRRGFLRPPKIGPSTILDGLFHPGWTWGFLRNEPILFANVVDHSLSWPPYVSTRSQPVPPRA
jgi:hypothetical protein